MENSSEDVAKALMGAPYGFGRRAGFIKGGGTIGAGPAERVKGVCKCHRTGILNRGSGGRGQPHIGSV